MTQKEPEEYSVADQFRDSCSSLSNGEDSSPADEEPTSRRGTKVADTLYKSPNKEGSSVKIPFSPDKILDSIDILKVMRGLLKHKRTMAFFVAGFTLLAVLSYLQLRGKSFSATVRLLYRSEENKTGGWGSSSSLNLESFSKSTVVGMLQYPSVLESVTNRLGVTHDLGALKASLLIVQPSESDVVRLEYYNATSSTNAIEMVNTIADCAVEYNAELYRGQIVDMYDSLKNRMNSVGEILNERERAVEEFQNANRMLNPGVEHEAYLDMVSKTALQLSQAKISSEELGIRIVNYEKQLEQLPDEVISRSYENSPLKRRISNLSMTLMAARTKYQPDNPKVKRLEKQMSELRKALNNNSQESEREQIFEPNPVKKEMEGELVRLKIQKRATSNSVVKLEENLEKIKSRFNDMPRKDLEYASLVQQKNMAEEIYTKLKATVEHAEIAMTDELADFEIIEYAREAAVYGSPASKIVPAFLTLFGLMGGLATALIMELCDPYLRTRKEMEQSYDLPCLTAIPYFEELGVENSAELLVNYVREISNRIRLVENMGNQHSIGFFSTDREEGKSTLSFQLARYFVGLGMKVVYLDFDYHKNPILERVDFSADFGLIAYLKMNTEIKNLMCNYEGLDFFKAEIHDENLPELIKSTNMARLWDYLQREYEIVIVDSPPVKEDGVAVEIAKLIEVPVSMVASSKVKKSAFDRSIALLEMNGISPKATLINMVDSVYESKAH